MKPPDSITDGAVVLRKCERTTASLLFRFGMGSLDTQADALRVVVLAEPVAAH